MLVICTTVIRGADNFQLGGRILEVEIPSGEVITSMNLPNKGFVSGPRGGSRGGRGVRAFGGRIYVAVHNRIFVYDLQWNLVSEIWHPCVAGHHEIQVDAEGVWCCSTLVDAIIKLDFEGRILFEWWASEDEGFVSWVKARKILWDRNVDYSAYHLPDAVEAHPNKQFHINSVYNVDGRICGYDSSHKALFVVWPEFKPILRNLAWHQAHNVCPRGRDILVNNSALKSFEIWRVPNPLQRLWRRKPYLVQTAVIVEGEDKSTQFSKSGWIRGRIDLGPNEFIVGCNPASLHYIKEGRVMEAWQLSTDVNEAVHGLTLKSP